MNIEQQKEEANESGHIDVLAHSHSIAQINEMKTERSESEKLKPHVEKQEIAYVKTINPIYHHRIQSVFVRFLPL